MTFSFYSNGIQACDGGDLPENVVTTDGAQTLTNKTIDADNNNIANLGVDNFNPDVVRDTVRNVDEATDTNIVTEKAVAKAVGTYIHDQAISSDVWVIEHNLGRYPSVTVVDSAENVVEGDYTYLDENRVILKFNSSFVGKAFFN